MTDPPPGSRFFASFRDPAGRLCRLDGRILRLVGRAEAGEIRAFLASDLSHTLTSRRWLIPSTELPPRALADLTNAHPDLGVLIAESATGMVIEHEAIPFPSYPHEWPAEMLHAAGELTLDLALELLPYGLGLKDATPYNVQFRGPAPVFVDVLSIERRRPGDRVWLPYAQFGRTFLLPLLLWQRKGVPPCESLASRRDGVEPEAAVRHFGPLDRLRPPVLTLATLPAKLSGRSTAPPPAPQGGDPEKAAYVLGAVLRQLRRTLTRLTPRAPRSQWTSYHDSRAHYSEEGAAAKSEFVQRAVSTLRPTRVLDVGCNVGHFSELAARAGSSVVAIDADPAVVGAAWRRLGQTSLDVLPLVVNLARPTPALGWRNREYPAFLDRAAGRFDLVLMLAVLHHLVVTDRIPLDEIVTLVADLTVDAAIVEYIGPRDPMFRQIARGRDELHAGLTPESFERSCRAHFDVERSEPLSNSERRLYLLRKRRP